MSKIKMTNWPFLVCMTLACCLASMSVGAALFNDGPIADIVAARQKWPKKYAKDMNKYFLMAPSLGIICGATIAGKMLKTGRRLAFLTFPLVGGIGSFLSVFDEYFIMMLGKFLFGVGAGVCITVAPRVLEETIPPKYFDKYGFGAMTNVGVDVMILTATIMTMLMPHKGHKHVTEKMLEDSTLYKWLYVAPIPLFGTAFVLAIMCFRRESVGFYIHKKDKENSIRAIRQIFMGETDEDYAKRYKKMVESDEEKPPESTETGADITKQFGWNPEKELKDKEAEEKKKLKDKEK
jgi:MFS family permease